MKPANLYYAIPAPYQNQLECVAAPPESYKANNSKNTTETVKYSRQAVTTCRQVQVHITSPDNGTAPGDG